MSNCKQTDDDLQQVEQICKQFMHAYIVERDLKRTFFYVTDDVCRIGTGRDEVCEGKQAFWEMAQRNLITNTEKYGIKWRWQQSRILGDGYAEVVGEAVVDKSISGEDCLVLEMRMSALLRREGDVYKICTLHISNPSCVQEPKEFYPVQFSEKTLTQLKSEIQEKSMQLLNESLAGGMIGAYLEPGYPLYFINNEMLRYLGYTYESFLEMTKGLVLNSVYPDDRAYVDKVLQGAITEESGGYTVQHRMLKQDGSILWMLVRGRRTISDDGRVAVITICTDVTDMVSLQQKLEEKNKRLERKTNELNNFYNTVISGIAKLVDDGSYTFIYGNAQYYRMLGYAERLSGAPPAEGCCFSLYSADIKGFEAAVQAGHGENMAFSHKARILQKDGAIIWVRIDGCRSDESYGDYPILYCLFTDIDQQREQEKFLRKQQYFTSLLLSSRTAGTMIVYRDELYSFAYVSDGLISFLGYEKTEFENQIFSATDFIYEKDRDNARRGLEQQLITSQHYEVEYRVERKDGNVIWVLERGNATLDEDGREVLICILLDISQRKRTQDQLLLQSKMDALTGVYNRRAAEDDIKICLLSRDTTGENHALFLLDVDNFKLVNDSQGHVEGDRVLTDIAQILEKIFRREDIIARLGGDEFIVFMRDVTSSEAVSSKAQMICETVKGQISERLTDIFVSVSIGISITDENTDTFQRLYRAADKALYEAKCGGKNTYRFHG